MPDIELTDPQGRKRRVRIDLAPGEELTDAKVSEVYRQVFGQTPKPAKPAAPKPTPKPAAPAPTPKPANLTGMKPGETRKAAWLTPEQIGVSAEPAVKPKRKQSETPGIPAKTRELLKQVEGMEAFNRANPAKRLSDASSGDLTNFGLSMLFPVGGARLASGAIGRALTTPAGAALSPATKTAAKIAAPIVGGVAGSAAQRAYRQATMTPEGYKAVTEGKAQVRKKSPGFYLADLAPDIAAGFTMGSGFAPTVSGNAGQFGFGAGMEAFQQYGDYINDPEAEALKWNVPGMVLQGLGQMASARDNRIGRTVEGQGAAGVGMLPPVTRAQSAERMGRIDAARAFSQGGVPAAIAPGSMPSQTTPGRVTVPAPRPLAEQALRNEFGNRRGLSAPEELLALPAPESGSLPSVLYAGGEVAPGYTPPAPRINALTGQVPPYPRAPIPAPAPAPAPLIPTRRNTGMAETPVRPDVPRSPMVDVNAYPQGQGATVQGRDVGRVPGLELNPAQAAPTTPVEAPPAAPETPEGKAFQTSYTNVLNDRNYHVGNPAFQQGRALPPVIDEAAIVAAVKEARGRKFNRYSGKSTSFTPEEVDKLASDMAGRAGGIRGVYELFGQDAPGNLTGEEAATIVRRELAPPVTAPEPAALVAPTGQVQPNAVQDPSREAANEAGRIATGSGGDFDKVLAFLQSTRDVPYEQGGNLHDLVAGTIARKEGRGAGQKRLPEALRDLVDKGRLTGDQAAAFVRSVNPRVFGASATQVYANDLADSFLPPAPRQATGSGEEGGWVSVIKGAGDARRLARYEEQMGDPTDELTALLGREPTEKESLDFLSLRRMGQDAKTDPRLHEMNRKVVENYLQKGRPVPPEVLADYPDLAPKVASPASPASAVEPPAPAVAEGAMPPEPLTGDRSLPKPTTREELAAWEKSLEPEADRIAARLGEARQQATSYRDSLKSEAEKTYATWAIRNIFETASNIPNPKNIRGNENGQLLSDTRARAIRKKIEDMNKAAYSPEEAGSPTATPSRADALLEKLDAAEKAANERINNRIKRIVPGDATPGSFGDPDVVIRGFEDLADYSVIAAVKAAKLGIKSGQWAARQSEIAAQLVREYGKAIEPHLDVILQQAGRLYEERISKGNVDTLDLSGYVAGRRMADRRNTTPGSTAVPLTDAQAGKPVPVRKPTGEVRTDIPTPNVPDAGGAAVGQQTTQVQQEDERREKTATASQAGTTAKVEGGAASAPPSPSPTNERGAAKPAKDPAADVRRIRMEDIERTAADLGRPLPNRKEYADTWDAAKARAMANYATITRNLEGADPKKVGALSQEETIVANVNLRRLTDSEIPELARKIEEAEAKGDADAVRDLNGRLQQAYDHADRYAQIAHKAGSEAGRRLALQRTFLDGPFDAATLVKKARAAAGGKLSKEATITVTRLAEKGKRIERNINDRYRDKAAESLRRLENADFSRVSAEKVRGCL